MIYVQGQKMLLKVIVMSLKFIGTLGEYFQDRDSSTDMNKVFVLLHFEFPKIVFNT